MKLKRYILSAVFIGLLVALAACSGDDVSPDAPFIAGTVFDDANANGEQDEGEVGLAGRVVYLDANDNASLDAGEVSVETDAEGGYQFSRLEPGDYTVRQVLPFGWRGVSNDTSTVQARASASAKVKAKPSKQPKIVGGLDADISDFPFMVALGTTAQEAGETLFFQFCGGVLISDTWVLTAAHCSVGDEKPSDPAEDNLNVFVGSDLITGDGGTVVPVSRVLVHPEYNLEAGTVAGYDVALWELAEPVTFSDRVRTVAMQDETMTDLSAAGTLATAVGWGTLASGGPQPEQLQVVNVPVLDQQQCFMGAEGVANIGTQLCAAVPEGGIDTCQGDSGGPLLVRNGENDSWLHVGITSYGDGCAAPGSPGIYARTSVLSAWVRETAAAAPLVQRVEVEKRSEIETLNFANLATTDPVAGEIAPRWQVTNLSPDAENPAPDAETTLNWRIIDEGTSTYTCRLDSDGPGPVAPEQVSCSEGSNAFTVEAGYAEGVYLPKLEVSKAADTYTRQPPLVVGNPVSDTQAGELSANDPIDPDYEGSYYIDYYELDLTGVAAGTAVLLQIETEAFAPFLALYDAGERDPAEGGGNLGSGGSQLIFVADGETSYLVGVSSFDEMEVGGYSLSTSSGSLTAQ